MRNFVYNHGDENALKDLYKYLRSVKEGSSHLITVKVNRPIRSLSANKYYHAIINIIAIHTGHTHEQLHDICKHKFNADIIHLPKGGTQVIGKSTSDLDTKEFAAYVNRVKQFALDEFDLIIPDAQDVDTKMWLDIQNNYDRVFSGF